MKLLRLLFLSTLPVWALTACSPKPASCDPTSCTSGCCDANGQCQLGAAPEACGTGGQLCTQCFPGQLCSQGLCRAGMTGGGMGGTGGGTGGGGGGTTGPLTCAGGKTACAGSCVDTSNDRRNCGNCGTLCNSNQFCSNGACTLLPTNCAMNRCPAGFFCDGSNECKPGCAANTDCPQPGVCDTRLNVCTCVTGFHACGQSCEADNNVTACGPSCANCGGIDNAVPACANNRCDFTCNTGFHRCGNECKRNDVAESCGSNCEPCQPPANSVPICVNEQCDFVCNTGFHKCGNQCLSNTDVNSCGSTSCTPCVAPANGTATCNGFSCDFTCNTGFHRCGNQCLSNTSTASCGTSCTPCSPPSNATATCNGVSCGFSCNAATHACNGQCVSNNSVNSCGPSSCTPCSPPLNGVATCNGTSCDFTCTSGTHRCGSTCSDNTSVNSCGTSCTPCPSGPANSVRTCSFGTCGWSCATGFHECNGQCVSDSSTTQCGASCVACTAPMNGSSICSSGSCDFVCMTGFHRCGNQCLSNTDVNSCGASCTPCSASVPANSTPSCNGTSCGFTCNSGFNACNGECVPADFASACGSSCTACTATGTFDRPTCVSGACATACQTSCNSACVDVKRDPAHCGACGTTCAGGSNCIDGTCRTACTTGPAFTNTLPFLTVSANANYKLIADDVNGDGRVDLIDNGASTGLHVRLSNADGTFQAPILLSVSARANAFAVADMNGDGRKDIVASRALTTSQFAVFINNGTSFSTGAFTSTSTATPGGVLLVTDLNGDTRPDVIMTTTTTTVYHLIQTTTGTFTWSTQSGTISNPQHGDLADFNKDMRMDLAVAGSTGWAVYLGTPSPTFPASSSTTAWTFTSTTSLSGIASVRASDVNADTNPDLVMRASTNAVIATGTGTGTFTSANFALGGATNATVVPADLNGDGLVDLASGSTGLVYVALATAAGTWGTPLTRQNNGPPNVQTVIAVGQLLGSPAPEIFAANQSATAVVVSIQVNDGTGTFPEVRTTGTSVVHALAAAGDVDGDGDLDLVATPAVASGTTGTGAILLGSNDGTFSIGNDVTLRGDAMVLGRINADAFADLAVAIKSATNPGVEVYLAASGATLGAPVRVATAAQANAVQIARLDADSFADLVVATTNGLEWFPGNGDGTFGAGRVLGSGNVAGIAVADLNMDGRPDLLSHGGTGTLRVYLGVADGGFTVGAYASYTTSSQPSDVAIADFDADGRPDVAVSTNAGVMLFKGNGNGTLTARPTVSLSGRLSVADLDNDGQADLLATQTELRVARSTGNFTFAPPQQWQPGRNVQPFLVTGRFNNDAFTDVVLFGTLSETFGYLGTCR